MRLVDDSSDDYELSTGRRFNASLGGYIGLSADGSASSFATGADGGEDVGKWTEAERHELADFMIGLWTVWRDGDR